MVRILFQKIGKTLLIKIQQLNQLIKIGYWILRVLTFIWVFLIKISFNHKQKHNIIKSLLIFRKQVEIEVAILTWMLMVKIILAVLIKMNLIQKMDKDRSHTKMEEQPMFFLGLIKILICLFLKQRLNLD